MKLALHDQHFVLMKKSFKKGFAPQKKFVNWLKNQSPIAKKTLMTLEYIPEGEVKTAGCGWY